MATFKSFINPKQKRDDGTYRVYISLVHQRKTFFIKTEHFVTNSQLTKGFELKDEKINLSVANAIRSYREKCDKLSIAINGYSCAELKEYLITPEKKYDRVNR